MMDPLAPWIPGYEGDVLDSKPEDVADLDEYGVDYEILGWGNGVMRVRLPADDDLEILVKSDTNEFYYMAPYGDDV